MNKIAKIALAMGLAGASVTASAWWGGPFSGWGDDFFGDGFFDMNVSMHGAGHGWGDYYDYYGPYGYPYWGAVPPPVYGYPAAVPAPTAALTEEQQKALVEQQKAMAEQQAKALQQAIEAQRKLAEQFQKGQAPRSFEPLTDPMMPVQFKDMLAQSEKERQASLKEMAARQDAFWKRVEARRKAMRERSRKFEEAASSTVPFAPFTPFTSLEAPESST